MNSTNIRKLTITAIFAAFAVVGSLINFPVLGSKCSPVQALVNILCAIFVGPWYGLACAFIASFLRNILGIGSLLAFPGSMFGVFLASILYKYINKLPVVFIGEVIGTGIIGAIVSAPIAIFFMGKDAALFGFVVPFLISSGAGTIIAIVVVVALKKAGLLDKFKRQINC